MIDIKPWAQKMRFVGQRDEPDIRSVFVHKRFKLFARAKVNPLVGSAVHQRDRAINVVFVAAIAVLFALDVLRHLMGLPIPLPPLFSLELGVLLVSVKIIWMIHKQSKVEHFQFWILNSIEFRLNDLARRMQGMEQTLTRALPESADEGAAT